MPSRAPKAKLLKQFLVAEGSGSASLSNKLFAQELKICFSIASSYTPRYSPIKRTPYANKDSSHRETHQQK